MNLQQSQQLNQNDFSRLQTSSEVKTYQTYDPNTTVSIDWEEFHKQLKQESLKKRDNSENKVNSEIAIKTQSDATQPETTPKPKIKTKRKAVNGKVNALRTPEQIQAVKDYFLNYNDTTKTNNKSQGIRNYCLFVFGINTALRASDILMFTIGEILDEEGNFQERIIIKEKKTSKKRHIYLNNTVKEAIRMYLGTLEEYSLDDFLFPSNKKKWDEEKEEYVQQPINVRSFWRIMNQCGKDLGLDKENVNLGTHSMRKTFTKQMILNNPDKPNMIIAVSEVLNHADLKTTYRYADITADEQRELFMNNQL